MKGLRGVRTPVTVTYMNTDTAKWTHTATLAKTYAYGPKQFGKTVAAGQTVTLWQNPAQEEGGLITFRFGRDTGVVRVSDLRNIEAK